MTIEDAKILEEGSIFEIEITIKVKIEVLGKGKGYQQEVFVQPNEAVEVLKQRVHFLKLFLQRKHQLVVKDSERVIDDYTRSFKDYELKDGT